MGKEDILLQMNHISKSFGKAVIALSDVQLELRKGEVLALLGENGEGKSTFMSIVTGQLLPDEGKVEWSKYVKAG